MTPSQLSIVVKSEGISKATDDLNKLAQAGANVDKETKDLIIASAKLSAEQAKAATASAKLQTELKRQELVISRIAATEQAAADAHARSAQIMQAAEERKLAAIEKTSAREEAAAVKKAAQQEAEIQRAGRMQSVTEQMSKKLDEKANKLEHVTSKGNVYVNTLRSMATAASAYLGVNFLANMVKEADAWGMMQSKLKLAIGDMTVAKNVQQDLFDMSQRLRVPLEDSAKLFTRMSVPLQKMGIGVRETEKIVGAFSTALKLAGATGQEASSAMLQFSQSINAGRLNGGEFNSIAEASPNILRAIEAELVRTGRGAELASRGLKKMASDGKLTTDVLVAALKNAAPQWQKDFESLPITVDGALTRIKNAWQKAIGELGQDTKFNQKMAESLKKLEDMLPAIAKSIVGAFSFLVDNGDKILAIFGGITAAMVVFKTSFLVSEMVAAATAINTATGAAGGFSAALARIGITPVGLAIVALGTAVGVLVYNWDNLTKSVSAVNKVNAEVSQSSGAIVKGIQNENIALEVQIDKLRIANGELAKYNREKLEGSKISAQTNLDELNRGLGVLENNLKAAQKAQKDLKELSLFDPNTVVKKNKAKEDIEETQRAIDMQKRAIIIATADLETNRRLQAEKDEKQRQTDLQKKVEAIYAAAKSEKQLLKEQYFEKINTSKLEAKQLGMDDFYLKQELLNHEKWYRKELEKIQDKSKKLKETTKPLDLWKEITDERKKESEKAVKDHEKLLISLEEENVEAEKQLDILKRQLYENDSIKKSKAEQSVIEAEANLIKAQSYGIFSKEFELAEKRLNIAKQTLSVTNGIEAKKQFQAQAEKYENAYQAANKKIEDGLYNAIGRGSEFGIKKLIQDLKSWFARLVLSPIIQPISQFGASIMNPNAASASSNPMDVITNIGSAFSKLMSNGSTAFADTIGKAGTFFGSEFMTSVSAAMKVGGTGFTGMAATALNAMPYVAAAVAAFDGMKAINKGYQLGNMSNDLQTAIFGIAPRLFGMQDKQMTGQTVTGNLGTDNLSRNVAWSQKGGLFRSDRSGTWSYNLANSTAIQDGKAYQDTASMSSDKALLDQLNSMYSALKTSTADMAKSLNLSADEILKRNDAINFAFGKDSQETSSNITKAFENIANAMSKDLLGGLISLAKVGESSSQTLMRLSTTIGSVNNVFNVLGYKLFDINEAGIKSADALVTLFGGLDKFQALTQSYYDNFYKESEKTEKALKVVKEAIKALGITDDIKTREDFRAQVEKAQKAGNDTLVKSLLELSGAFAQVVDWAEQVTEAIDGMNYQGDVADMPSLQGVLDSVVEGIKKLASEAERWYNIRNQAASMQSSIDDILGNPKKDPSIRMRQLWDAMAKDISPEQKLALAGELKDLMIAKYQVEKDSLTKLIDFGKQLRGYVDTLKVGSLSPLTMTDKLLEAKAQYESTLAKAQSGDVAAQGSLQGKSETYLQLAQTAFASSGAYVEIFNSVTSSLDNLGIESMSAADRTISLSESQLTELQRLKDFINAIEVSSNSYYEASLTAMYEQTKIANDLYARLGNLEGLTPILSGLPAEIAAALNGKANEEWVRNLYSTMAGKTGSAVDSEGLDYWMNEVDTYGKAYVQTAFQNSVNTVRAMAPSPMFANNQTQNSNSAVQEELKALKEELAKQTVVLAETILTSNKDNANTIVNGTNQNNAQSSWMKETMPTIN